MKYTFEDKGKSRTVDVPDNIITQHKRDLGISTKEAIELYLFDEGIIENTEQAQLQEKAQGVVQIKNTTGKRKQNRKPDMKRRNLLDYIATDLSAWSFDDDNPVEKVNITNVERTITFSIGKDNYELTLSKKRVR